MQSAGRRQRADLRADRQITNQGGERGKEGGEAILIIGDEAEKKGVLEISHGSLWCANDFVLCFWPQRAIAGLFRKAINFY